MEASVMGLDFNQVWRAPAEAPESVSALLQA